MEELNLGSQDKNMEFVKFYEIVNDKELLGQVTNPLARELLERLKNHGEMQVDLASGKTISFHLGDVGYVTPTGITIRFANAEIYTMIYDQIETFWSHQASAEG